MSGKRFKILCIDGGGIKGLYSAEVLNTLEYTYGPLSDYFDMLCGTSTGGIIALGISAKIPMQDIVKFYESKGAAIFSQWKKFWPLKDLLLMIKQSLICSKYSNRSLKKALVEVFGERKIAESNNLLCIPSYNITCAQTRVFKKDYNQFNQDDQKTYVDVALATSAAPTYFPLHTINNVDYIDGGLWANDPTLVAISEYLYSFSDEYEGVDILSISSCEKSSAETLCCKNRSFLAWSQTLFDIYNNGQNQSSRFFVEKLKNHLKFDLNIVRIQNAPLSPQQAKIIAMDNASKHALKCLSGIGKTVGANYKDKPEVKKFFETKKTFNF